MTALTVFQAYDATHGTELWVTDGTLSGTSLLVDIAAGIAGSGPSHFTQLGDGRVLFSAADLSTGVELWITDGTASGTSLVADLDPSPYGSSNPSYLTRLGDGRVVFMAREPSTGHELWVSDGTSGGTSLLADINPGYGSSYPSVFSALGDGRLVFGANNGSTGFELWVTDGTSVGTSLLADINPGLSGSYATPRGVFGDGRILLVSSSGSTGGELWVTDGTASGTQQVAPLVLGGFGFPSEFAQLGEDKLVFAGASYGAGRELWITDGSAAGTSVIKDLFPGNINGNPGGFISLGDDRLLFSARDPEAGRELWITDGSASGTYRIADLRAGYDSSNPANPIALGNGKVVFSASGSAGRELWVTDGSAIGTYQIAGPSLLGGFGPFNTGVLSGGRVVFEGSTTNDGSELWVTDGTSAGTSRISDINPGAASSSPRLFHEVDASKVLFTANDGTSGEELWVTDGTAAGTYRLADANGGSASSFFGQFFTISADTNEPPVADDIVEDGEVSEDSLWTFTIPTSSFVDPDGDTLAYSASLADGNGLPSWLSFVGTTRTFVGTPPQDFAGTLNLRVTATDPQGQAASQDFTLVVVPVNDAPRIGAATPDMLATEDDPFTLVVPAGTFTDPDAGDTLTLAADLPDGGPLPAWLAFDPGTGTFSGTPANADVGAVTIRLTATDSEGASVSDSFVLTIANTNDAPVVVAPLPGQSATEDSPFAFTIPAGTFADSDAGDTLTLSATLADGGPLPAWLAFDAATGTFSGTPDNDAVGSITLRVTATDTAGATAFADVTLDVANTNDAPLVAAPVADVITLEDAPLSVTIPAGTFADPDAGDTLTLALTLAGGAPLPAWLSFDAATGTLSGNPGNDDLGTIALRLTATDAAGASISDDFDLTVQGVNDAPVLILPVADQAATEDQGFSLSLPATLFADPDAGDTLTITVTAADGGALPAWLSYSPVSGLLTGTPLNGDVGTVTLRVVATDAAGATTEDSFDITVANTNDAPTAGAAILAPAATEDAPFSFTLPTGIFVDPDAGDTLAFSATAADGGALPAWLSFDPVTWTFSGTPGNAEVGIVTLSVTATDAGGLTATQSFDLTVLNTNDAPILAAALADETAVEGQAFTATLPAGSFLDPDAGDTLTLAAALVGGGPLPSWLSFDAASGTFSGTPADGDVGSIVIRVTATDAAGATASDELTLTVLGLPDAPVITGIATDTGAPGDGVTADPTITLNGTADPGVTIVVSLDGVGVIGTATADGAGAWSFDYGAIATLPSDTYSFTAVAEAAGGLVSPSSAPFAVTVDTEAPDAPTSFTAVLGGAGGDTLLFSGTGEAGATIQVFRGATAILSTVVEPDGTWQAELTGFALPSGPYAFAARTTDLAGNLSAPVLLSVLEIAADNPLATIDGGDLDASLALLAPGTAANDAITGGAARDTLAGQDGADLLRGQDGDDSLSGGNANDTLQGGNGADLLDGGAGIDSMVGGAGDDVFLVSDVGDVAVEAAGQGLDEVRASVTHTLGLNIERLVQTGAANIAGTGNALNNLILGNAGNNNLSGNTGDDSLEGGQGNDTLNGGAGLDSMTGGEGNDVYSVDAVGDTVVEAAGGGTDLVNATITYTLGAEVENLTLTGAAALAGTGNAAANVITGNTGTNLLQGLGGNDTLNGGLGADTMSGGEGDDTYIVDNAGDILIEASGEGLDTALASVSVTLADAVENLTLTGSAGLAGTGNALGNLITGNSGANTLAGLDGNDTLNGGSGADAMTGGLGDDTYVVDSLLDLVNELATQGFDTIRTGLASYSLAGAAQVEALVYTGTGNFSGTGNDLGNLILGGNGADTLNGAAGADTMTGGAGADVYIVDDAGDVLVEAAGGGLDTIRTTLAAYSLAALPEIERLTFTGAGSFAGSGNAGANTLTGGVGNDILDGGAGADSMVGGAGNDLYLVDSALDLVAEGSGGGTDTIRTTLQAFSLAALSQVENLAFAGAGSFAGTGNTAANGITGGAGNDTLNGGAGVDTLTGGEGDDTYVVDSALDSVVELAGQGTDLVQTALASFSLAAFEHVENLTYTATGAFTGTGNAGANVLTGGVGNDTLSGAGGTDTLIGGGGADVYVVDDASDVVVEVAGGGLDTIRTSMAAYSLASLPEVERLTFTGAGSFSGAGNAGANTLIGGALGDTLDGGAGADSLAGGAGDDVYIIDSALDVVSEGAGGGWDSVWTSLGSFSLVPMSQVEELLFTGAGAFAATGNSLANRITGGAGNDTLNGGLGGDTLLGGLGDDVYVVDSVLDAVVEDSGAGFDVIRTSLTSYSIAALVNVEALTFTGGGSFNGAGNGAANLITGGAGNDTLGGDAGADTLRGGLGADRLTGGPGGDAFRYGAANEGGDVILGFNAAEDVIEISASGFGGGLIKGALPVAHFVAGGAATGSVGQVLFNGANGQLSWDADGTGAGTAVLLATLGAGLAFSEANVSVIA